MITEFCSLPHWELILIAIVVGVLSELLEFWLGRTDKVKAGSKFELIMNLIVWLFRRK